MENWKLDMIILPFYILVVIVGIIGNSLFITVVRKRRLMQTTTNFLLANVAISDIISLMFCLPGIILRLFEHPAGLLGNFLCKFITMHSIAGITLLVSGLTLTVIAIERHNALLRPMDLRLKLQAKRRVIVTISAIWVFSIAFVCPLFIEQNYSSKFKTCHMDWSSVSSSAYWILLAIIGGVSLFILCFCYFRVVRALYLNDILPTNEGRVSAEQDSKDKRKIVKLLMTVTVLFFVCFLPFITVSAVNVPSQRVLYKLSYFFAYCSCSINPAVYLVQSENYRAGLRELWRGRPFRQRERSLES
ncbi:QRFP-like peptide receptor [Montipora foliosa]|uniref:QRFP-like peptide receptor n=1 Tax=Montipora foliosa TaxID=591990 RepID=UPI0035F10846